MSTNDNSTEPNKNICCILQEQLKFLLDMHRYNVEHMEQYYEHRAKLTSISLAIYGILLGATFNYKFEPLTIIFIVTLIIVSWFFENFMLKLYERSQYHRTRANKIRNYIDDEFAKHNKNITKLGDLNCIKGTYRGAATVGHQE